MNLRQIAIALMFQSAQKKAIGSYWIHSAQPSLNPMVFLGCGAAGMTTLQAGVCLMPMAAPNLMYKPAQAVDQQERSIDCIKEIALGYSSLYFDAVGTCVSLCVAPAVTI